MNKGDVATQFNEIVSKIQEFREAGQREYAHREDNAFGNFERVGERMKLSREKVLLVYMEKHLDGIHAYVDGHRSQREGVRGRILDAIVYLGLLYAMVAENEQAMGAKTAITPTEENRLRPTLTPIEELPPPPRSGGILGRRDKT